METGIRRAALGVASSLALVVTLAGCGGPATDSADASLGSVDFPVSCDRDVQVRFERAVALLHHMMYMEAQREFEAVATLDPECAMAHWGIAMSLFQPLWPTRPGPREIERGRAAVQKAKELVPESERERAYVAAVDAFLLRSRRRIRDPHQPVRTGDGGGAPILPGR